MNKKDNDLHLSYYLGWGYSFLLQEKLITPVLCPYIMIDNNHRFHAGYIFDQEMSISRRKTVYFVNITLAV